MLRYGTWLLLFISFFLFFYLLSPAFHWLLWFNYIYLRYTIAGVLQAKLGAFATSSKTRDGTTIHSSLSILIDDLEIPVAFGPWGRFASWFSEVNGKITVIVENPPVVVSRAMVDEPQTF